MWASRGLQNWNNGLQSQNKQKKTSAKTTNLLWFWRLFLTCFLT